MYMIHGDDIWIVYTESFRVCGYGYKKYLYDKVTAEIDFDDDEDDDE